MNLSIRLKRWTKYISQVISSDECGTTQDESGHARYVFFDLTFHLRPADVVCFNMFDYSVACEVVDQVLLQLVVCLL